MYRRALVVLVLGIIVAVLLRTTPLEDLSFYAFLLGAVVAGTIVGKATRPSRGRKATPDDDDPYAVN